MTKRYPDYDVLDKWDTVSFDTLTRGVIRQRLSTTPERAFFTEAEWSLLEAVAAHLAPTPERGRPIPIVAWIDAELANGDGEGYRFEDMPKTEDAWRKGLALMAEEARTQYGRPFEALDELTQTSFLKRLQKGEVEAARWAGLDPKRFFSTILLKAVVGVYYAFPQAWSEIGFGGPASPRGYVRIGLNEHDPWEAREAKTLLPRSPRG